MRRRDFVLFAGFDWLVPTHWFHRDVRIAETRFRKVRHGPDVRRYIWIHGDETTAGEVLRSHIRSAAGIAFLVENRARTVPLSGGELDPNRMFSSGGAEKNLRALNPSWDAARIGHALRRLERDRESFLANILPAPRAGLLVALHNNGPGYSIQDEIPISDAVSLKDSNRPDEFVLCTSRSDFEKLKTSTFNSVLQESTPPDEDGSLSRLCAARGVRYVNIEAARGNAAAQSAMLQWVDKTL